MDSFEKIFNGLLDAANSAADVGVYSAIRSYVNTRIDYFMVSTLSNFLAVLGAAALSIMTVWIMIQGFLMVTGRSQEGMKGFIFKAFRAYIIVAIATGVATTSGGIVQTLTDDLSNSISEVMTGDTAAAKCLGADNNFLGCKINRSFLVSQAVVTFIGGFDALNDPSLESKKTQATYFAQAGSVGPAIVAGTMLLMFKFGMALFVAFGPLFIICLLFKQTQSLFQKWLMYGIGLMFANATLAVVADISMDLTLIMAKAIFVTDIVAKGATTLLGIPASTGTGVMQAATQQLGLGLLLSTLIISVPPIAANFFSAMLGNFNQNASFGSFGMGWAPKGGAASQDSSSGSRGFFDQGGRGAGGQAPTAQTDQKTQTSAPVNVGTRTSVQSAPGLNTDRILQAHETSRGLAGTQNAHAQTTPPTSTNPSASTTQGTASTNQTGALQPGSPSPQPTSPQNSDTPIRRV